MDWSGGCEGKDMRNIEDDVWTGVVGSTGRR